MALTLDEIESTTQEYWEPGAQDQYYHGNVLMYMCLRKAKPWPGGTYIRQVLDYGQALGGDFNASSTFDTTKVETMTAARWTPAYYYEPVTYDIDDEVKNAGPAQQVDIVNAKLTKSQKHLRDKLATDLYASSDYGDSGKKLIGLPGMISTSATYGGIAVADLSEWVAGAVTTTATPITFAVIDTLLTNCTVGDTPQDEPDLMVTTRSLFSALRGLTLPHLRLEHGDLADMGFKNIDYLGNPVVRDYKCTSTYFYALNTNFFGFRVHKDFNFKRTPWMRPTNQYLFTCQLIVVLQMICKRRDAHGMHYNLTA